VPAAVQKALDEAAGKKSDAGQNIAASPTGASPATNAPAAK